MSKGKEAAFVEELFEHAGIKINGDRPFDIRIHDQRFYQRLLNSGPLGLGESYMDGWWDCEALDQFFDVGLRAGLEGKFTGKWLASWPVLKAILFNLQKSSRAAQVGELHYDLGNDLYQAMLDKRLNYTCGYWKTAKDLDEAQEAKLALICRKLDLQPGMSVLELGCGFGAFAGYAAEKYGVKVTGLNVSKEQVKFAKERYKGLPVEFRLEDYRKASGTYDRVISIGIIEHVGYKNYDAYMQVVDRTLKKDGIGFIHTIGNNTRSKLTNAWINKYIFRNSMIPAMSHLGKAMEGFFVMEDWHNFGPDYDKTVLAWCANFEDAWPDLKEKYGERFYRMWRYYLLSSAGAFRSRTLQLWQIVMTKPGRDQPECRNF